MKKFMVSLILFASAVIFCQQPVVLSDEYHLWNGSGWNKKDYEYNTVDNTGSITVKTTPEGTYSRYEYEGYYQLEYYNSGSSGNSAWNIDSHYKYDENDYLIKISYSRENYWMGIFDGAWGNDTFLIYLDGLLSSKKEIDFEYGKEITSNTLTEYTYNPDGTINSESYSDSTSAGWVKKSRILWSYNKGTSTGIKESYTGTEWVNSEKYDRVLNVNLDPVTEYRSVWNGSAWEPSELDEIYYNSANSHIKTVTYTYNTETGEYDLYSKRELLWNDGIEMNSISGYAFLEGLDNHSGIEVFFQRVVPDSAFTLTAFTNSSGYFSGLIEDGYYDVSYSKSGFSDTVVEDVNLYSDQTLADQTIMTTGIENNETAVSSYELLQNYPNPFNPVTAISYSLPKAGQVELNVYNLQGQLVQSLVKSKQDKGIHKADFNGADLTSGMYVYSLKVDGKSVQSKKMMMLK